MNPADEAFERLEILDNLTRQNVHVSDAAFDESKQHWVITPKNNKPPFTLPSDKDANIKDKHWSDLQDWLKDLGSQAPKLKPFKLNPENHSTFIFDSASLIPLASVRNEADSKSSWLQLIERTMELPNVGAVIIPDFVADFEFRGIARIYDAKDKPLISDAFNGKKFTEERKRFDKFLERAIRVHRKPDGSSEYLAEHPEAKHSDRPTKLIIMETKLGRELEDKAYAILSSRKPEYEKRKQLEDLGLIRSKNNIGKEDHLFNNGEKCITEILRTKHAFNAPTYVISDDYNYINIEAKRHPMDAKGNPVQYYGTYSYLEAELKGMNINHEPSPRALANRQILQLGNVDPGTVYKAIRPDALTVNPPTPTHQLDDEEVLSLSSLIHNGYLDSLRNRGIKSAAQEQEKKQFKPNAKTREYGSLIKNIIVKAMERSSVEDKDPADYLIQSLTPIKKDLMHQRSILLPAGHSSIEKILDGKELPNPTLHEAIRLACDVLDNGFLSAEKPSHALRIKMDQAYEAARNSQPGRRIC